MARIGIVGGGAWGTALANVAAAAGGEVVLWAREPEVVEAVNRQRRNPVFLPDVEIAPAVRATADAAEACQADAVLLVAPAQHLRRVMADLAPHIDPGTPAVICAKGIEQGSNALMGDIVAQSAPHARLAVLSGPTFAAEVARGLPTAVTVACEDAACGEALVAALGIATFRPYLSDDVIGAQVGGAVKNVLAIACGIVSGRGLGDNARAALITRGMAEMLRLGSALGGRPETLMGLSGLGDLVLTCTSTQSRNTQLGIALAQGESAQDYLAGRRSVAEGHFSAAAVAALATTHGIEMPIAAAVDAILNRGAEIDETIAGLLGRPFRPEHA